MEKNKQNPIIMIDNNGVSQLKVKDAPKVKKMSPAEFVKYAADNHIKFEIPEDNRKYPGQKCQDENLNKAFRQLHEKLVNEIIDFCKEWHISVDKFALGADELEGSIKFGSWQACTDSYFTLYKFTQEYKDCVSMKNKESIDKAKDYKEWARITSEQEPYLSSM